MCATSCLVMSATIAIISISLLRNGKYIYVYKELDFSDRELHRSVYLLSERERKGSILSIVGNA